MTWFYADATRAQQGPVDTEELARLWQVGRIQRQTLVWRDGAAGWKPLADYAAELPWLGEGAPTANAGAALVGPPALPPGAPAPASDPGIVRGGFALRAFALIIDQMIVQMTVGMVLAIVLAVLIPQLSRGSGEPSPWVFAWIALAYFAATGAYFALMESSRMQATFGKQALGLKVCDLEGRRIGLGRALLRWLAALLNYLSLYIGWLLVAFGKQRRGLHDRIAGTQVVDQYAYSATPEKQRRGDTGCLDIGLAAGAILAVLFWLAMVAAISIPAYHDYQRRAALARELASAEPIKARVLAAIESDGECPDGMEIAAADIPPGFSVVWVGTFEDSTCGVQLTLAGRDLLSSLAGKQVWLWLDEDNDWACSSEVQTSLLPSTCRD